MIVTFGQINAVSEKYPFPWIKDRLHWNMAHVSKADKGYLTAKTSQPLSLIIHKSVSKKAFPFVYQEEGKEDT